MKILLIDENGDCIDATLNVVYNFFLSEMCKHKIKSSLFVTMTFKFLE